MKNKILKKNILIYINIVLLALVTGAFAEQKLANPIGTPAPAATQQLLPSPLALPPQQSYAIELQVNTQTEDERKQTFTKALDQVLTKNSGNPKITTLASIKTALSTPSLYVQRYTYATHNLAGVAVGQPALFLQIQFDQAAITQLLHLATQPEQKTDKQQTLVWGPKKLTLRVVNVNGLDQYNEVVQYLTSFNQTTQIDLVKIGSTEVELSINTKGDKQAFINMLNAQNKLVRNTDTPIGVDLDYKWVTVGNEQLQATSAKPLP